MENYSIRILEEEVLDEAVINQEKHLTSNSKEGMIKEYLDIKFPKNWYDMDIYMLEDI